VTTLIFAVVSVLALGIAGSRLSYAADMPNNSNGNTPGTAYVSENEVRHVPQQPKSAGIYKRPQTLQEARSRKFQPQKGVSPRGIRYDFNLGRR